MRNAIATLLVSIVIALLPVYNRIAAVDMNRTSKDNLFVIMCGLIGIIFNKNLRELPLKGWVVSAIALFLMIFNQHNVSSVMVIMYCFYATAGMFFLIRFYECFDKKHIDWIFDGMCAGALIQALIILANGLGYSPEYYVMSTLNGGLKVVGIVTSDFGVSTGSLGNLNLAGGYLALCSFAFFRKKWIYLLPVSIAALVSTGSALSVASFIAGAVYYFKGEIISKRNVYILTIFSMFLIFFTGIGGLDSRRFEIWRMMFAKTDISNYLFGGGLAWFQDSKVMLENFVISQEHSGFITLFNTFGFLGVAIFLEYLWKYINVKGENKLFSAILFAAFCNAYGHFSIQQSTMMMIILVTIAICAIREE